MTGFRGFRPVRIGDPGLGQVTPRIVDLLQRTRAWARAIVLVSFLGAGALLALCGFALVRRDPAALPLLAVLGIPALLLLVLAVPLRRFTRAVDRMVLVSPGASVFSAFEHLGSFWRRAGILVAALLALTVGGLLLAIWLGNGEPVAMLRDPQGWMERQKARAQERIAAERATPRGQSPLALKPAPFGRGSREWLPVAYPPASPGRSFSFEEIGEVCRSADATFLCLVNFPGEDFRGGTRRIFTRKDTAFTLLSRMDGSREILDMTMERSRTWHLRLAPPVGAPLMKTTYEAARYDTYGQEPLFAFATGSLDCLGSGSGRFRVVDLARGESTLPDRLVVDFEMECGRDLFAGRLSFQAER